eukprot:TRINITY_DN23144_c0_g1_i1.p1 TRINITY_DN23144_c0_g1~~TRINITY_DN23144_c0_g1_i1.p1  ORF type:complete len:1126 (+),score=241.94 TRINITY_DN23144_c0_g1_i1:255-3632(+)
MDSDSDVQYIGAMAGSRSRLKLTRMAATVKKKSSMEDSKEAEGAEPEAPKREPIKRKAAADKQGSRQPRPRRRSPSQEREREDVLALTREASYPKTPSPAPEVKSATKKAKGQKPASHTSLTKHGGASRKKVSAPPPFMGFVLGGVLGATSLFGTKDVWSVTAATGADKSTVTEIEISASDDEEAEEEAEGEGEDEGVAEEKPVKQRSKKASGSASKGASSLDDADVKLGTKERLLTAEANGVMEDGGREAMEIEDDDNQFADNDLISKEEGQKSWPSRYATSCTEPKFKEHYLRARIDDFTVSIGEHVEIRNGEDGSWVGQVLEIFKGETKEGKELGYFNLRWFYRTQDTVINVPELCDSKRVWWSTFEQILPLDTIIKVVQVVRTTPAQADGTEQPLPECDYFFNQGYSEQNYTFFDIPDGADAPFPEEAKARIGKLPHTWRTTPSGEVHIAKATQPKGRKEGKKGTEGASGSGSGSDKEIQLEVQLPPQEAELSMLDLYAGCGAMSTGLAMGGPLAGLTIHTRWAVDMDQPALKSLEHNHPETLVHQGTVENFLDFLKAWNSFYKSLTSDHSAKKEGGPQATKDMEDEVNPRSSRSTKEEDEPGPSKGVEGKEPPQPVTGASTTRKGRGKKNVKAKVEEEEKAAPEEEVIYEVESILGVRHGPAANGSAKELQFKVRWKNYPPSADTWEPIDNLIGCQENLEVFAKEVRSKQLLPMPGTVGIVCGGPPCQGISGHNRHRNVTDPFQCVKNQQLGVFMSVVKFLRPRFVLMENVTDMMKVQSGLLARHAVAHYVNMGYQSRTGIIAAGSFGVAQFRMRAFFYGARAGEVLPQFPMPTHLCHRRKNGVPKMWASSLVAWDEDTLNTKEVERGLTLGDCITDLPEVTNREDREEMPFPHPPKSFFERRMRIPKAAFAAGKVKEALDATKGRMKQTPVVYDHFPWRLNADDYERSCNIPKKKGACFRDLLGVRTNPDGKVEIDPNVRPRPTVASGKPLCPDYAITFRKGLSYSPFARVWWNDSVPTVVTRPQPHNTAMLHPNQDRVLTVRENARLQGFPDNYRLFGNSSDRYCQVGNAVSVPAAQALGFALGRAALRREVLLSETTFELPPHFPFTAVGETTNPIE